ncbi:MAG: DHA2 family efflux MFS transporter permease subunit [Burkholderiales bacterium]
MIPFLVGCALFMQMLDSTIVATALPAMAVALGTDPVQLNIAITSYLLAVAVFVPISGWAADRFGARRVFILAICIFTLSSLTCALSLSVLQLVISRTMQGVGGAMMVPVGRIILLRTFPKHELLKAMAFLSLPALVGPIIAPPLGGFLVTYASWHWIFLINVPIGAIGVRLVILHIREFEPDGKDHPLDVLGFLLSASFMAALVWGFASLGRPGVPLWSSMAIIVFGVASAVVFVWHARRHADPILDLSLLNIPTFEIATLAGNLCRFTIGATPFLLAMLLQVGFGLSAISAGLITFVGAVGAMLMKFTAPPILRRWGYRRVLMVNAVLTGAGVLCCAGFTPTTPMAAMLGVLLMGGFFRSLQFTALNTLAFADIPHERMSRASSFAAMTQQLSVSLGVGIAAGTLNVSMALRGDGSLAIADVVAGFIVIGLLCALAAIMFRRLPEHAGQALHGG